MQLKRDILEDLIVAGGDNSLKEFIKLFPYGIDSVPDDKLDGLIDIARSFLPDEPELPETHTRP